MKKPMLTKHDMAKRLHTELYIDTKNAKEILDRVFDYIAEGLIDGRMVAIDGLGRFKLSHRKARWTYNFQSKEWKMGTPFNAVRFFPSIGLRAAVRDTVIESNADQHITS